MGRVMLRLATLATTASLLASCSGDPAGDTAPAPSPTVPPQALVKDPESCLRIAKLKDAEQHDPRVWRAFAPDGSAVVVESVGPGIALNEAKRARRVWAYAAGPFFVHGPRRSADGSSTRAVADCLRVGRAGTASEG